MQGLFALPSPSPGAYRYKWRLTKKSETTQKPLHNLQKWSADIRRSMPTLKVPGPPSMRNYVTSFAEDIDMCDSWLDFHVEDYHSP
jgi:hypothetical protein